MGILGALVAGEFFGIIISCIFGYILVNLISSHIFIILFTILSVILKIAAIILILICIYNFIDDFEHKKMNKNIIFCVCTLLFSMFAFTFNPSEAANKANYKKQYKVKSERKYFSDFSERTFSEKKPINELFLTQIPEGYFCCSLTTCPEFIIQKVLLQIFNTETQSEVNKENLKHTDRLDIFCPKGHYDIFIEAYSIREKKVKTIESTFSKDTRFGEVILKKDGRLYFDESFNMTPYPIIDEHSETFYGKIPEKSFCCVLKNNSSYIIKKIFFYTRSKGEEVIFDGTLNKNEQIDMIYPFGKYNMTIIARDKESDIEKTFYETFTLKTKSAVVQITEDGCISFDENFKIKKK